MSNRTKRIIRKAIKAVAVTQTMVSFWLPFCVYVVTRAISTSLIALVVSLAIMLLGYAMYSFVDGCKGENENV